MKNKLGFTLIELIGTIAILAIIMSIALTLVTNIRSNVLKRDYDNIVDYLELAAAKYAEDTGVTTITVADLIAAGYVSPDDETDIYNPINNASLNCHIITSAFNSGAYRATFGEDIGQKDGKCNIYEKEVDLSICKYDENMENCTEIDDNSWYKNNMNLGLKYKNGTILKDENLTYSWLGDNGNTSDLYYITTNASLIYRGTYDARVIFEDNLVSEASKNINIDMQSPIVVESKLISDEASNSSEWSKSKSAIITASDYAGSGVAGIYAGNASTCTADLEYVKVDKENKVEIVLAEGENTVCVKDNVGNLSSSDYKILNDHVDGTGADWITLESSNPNGYARSLDIIGSAQDTKSGLVAYQFSTNGNLNANSSGWTTINKTNDVVTYRYNVTANGTYYFYVKDEVGNISSTSIEITNIDRVIDSITTSKNTSDYVTSVTLSGKATDNQAGIVAYQWTKSSSTPSSGWTNVSTTKEVNATYNVSGNGTYYFWVKDAVGNVDKKSINVNNVVRLTSTRTSEYSENSSYINGSIRLNDMKLLDRVEVNNGRVSYSKNGTSVDYSLSGGTTRWGSRRSTCTTRSQSYRAEYNEGGCRRWACNRGGEPDGDGYCVNDRGRTFSATGQTFRSTCTCSGGRYTCNSSGASSSCPEGYSRPSSAWFNCTYTPDIRGNSCSAGSSTSVNTKCQFTCVWDGDYRATCTSQESPYYSCDRGDYLEGSKCYYCNEGSLDKYDLTCSYTCYKDYSYWEYSITIYYYVLA